MLSILIILFFFACTGFVGFKFGVFVALGSFVGWSLGVVLASKLIEDLGRAVQHADHAFTITGRQGLDFVLAAFWPIGIPMIFVIGIGRRLLLRSALH